MGQKLQDGVVIPSNLGVGTITMESHPMDTFFSNTCLRVGTVTKAFPINDPKNRNKRRTEYSVKVYQADNGEAPVPVQYNGCILSNMFGGISDYLSYTLRTGTATPSNGKILSTGAAVLLLCANGDQGRTYIIGATNNSNRPADDPNSGHHLTFEFNGVNVAIDQDGGFLVTRKGPTDDAGEAIDLVQNYSTISMTPDGSMEFSNTNATGGCSIKLDKTTSDLQINSLGAINATANTEIAGTCTDLHVESGTVVINCVTSALISTPILTITNGLDPWPVLRAHPDFVAQFHAFNQALGIYFTQILNFTQTMVNDQSFSNAYPAEAAAAGQVASQAQQMIQLVEQYDTTMVNEVAISDTTLTT